MKGQECDDYATRLLMNAKGMKVDHVFQSNYMPLEFILPVGND